MELKQTIKRNIKNTIGTKTKRKIVVFYVDDYGSVRTKDRNAYNELIKGGCPFDNGFSFSKYDTLADKSDLTTLFEVLKSVKDSRNNFACFTPFTIVANPDFTKIRESGFNTYFREPFTETLKRYGSAYEGVFDLWKQGIHENIFYPVYHGTEHVNVKRLMQALQNGHKSSLLAFDNESVCVPNFENEEPVRNYTANCDIDTLADNEQLKSDIETGLKMFEELFGYRTKQFAPGAATYHPALHPTLVDNGVKYININRVQKTPLENGKYKNKIYFNGQKNELGQRYIVRNGIFEPHGKTGTVEADNCLKDIEAAFRWGAPAVISSHRVNFVGHFDEKWRDNSLMQLKYLIEEIVKKWPDVEFMNGDEMCDTLFRQ